MTNDIFLMTIAGSIATMFVLIVGAINTAAYLKYYRRWGYPGSAGWSDGDSGILQSGIYLGVERRARKRASGPVHRRTEEALAF